jgi:hypothetical protein
VPKRLAATAREHGGSEGGTELSEALAVQRVEKIGIVFNHDGIILKP